MIIRKPYAFLIKHFRLIHGILFVMLLYLAIKSLKIYSFFNDYATNHFYTPSANLTSSHISVLMFLACILVILISIAIGYLLSVKNKRIKLYVFNCMFYAILIAYYIYIFNVFSDLNKTALSIESVRAIRDISLIVVFPQVIFIVLASIRMLGFNLKKFEFKKDLQDLQIDASDYEEVEVTVGQDNYKFMRYIRKTLRYAKYFILENKFFVTGLGSVIVLSIFILIYINIKIENEKYLERQKIATNYMDYKAENSYYTQKSISGVVLKKNKTYILVDVEIYNKTLSRQELSNDTFRLETDKELKMPVTNLVSEFMDIGTAFSSLSLSSGETKKVVVAFEVDSDSIKDEYILKIRRNKNGEISKYDSQYKDVIIKPVNLDVEDTYNYYDIPSEINLNESVLGDILLNVESVELDNSFKENDQYCIKGNCYDKTVIIKPSSSEKIVLKLKVSMENNSDIEYANSISKIIETFGEICYLDDGATKCSKAILNTVKYSNDEYLYIDVPEKLYNTSEKHLVLTIRDKKYVISLK